MKTFYIFSLFLICAFGAMAQCSNPVSFREFTAMKQQLVSNNNATRVFNMAMDMQKSYCFSSIQLKELSMLLMNDLDRLDFLKSAYFNVYDPNNFDDVYDGFTSFSSAIKLYRFVNDPRNTPTRTPPPPPIYVPPVYSYPNIQIYKGAYGCTSYADNNTYMQIKQQVLMYRNNEQQMYAAANQVMKTYCLNVQQVMDLAGLFPNENMRYDLINASFTNLYDVGNYTYFSQLFATQQMKDKCMRSCEPLMRVDRRDNRDHKPDGWNDDKHYDDHHHDHHHDNHFPPTPPRPTPVPVSVPVQRCETLPNDFSSIKSSIASNSFESGKNTQLRTVTKGRCFSVAQTKELISMFGYESSKIDNAKYLYDFCNEKQNYYSVTEVFGYTSSKDELNRFLQGK
jgi:hypothetical protein